MEFTKFIQKFWKPILALLGVSSAASSAGTILLMMHFNILNGINVVSNHNPTATNAPNATSVQGLNNKVEQNPHSDYSNNKTEQPISIGVIGQIGDSITMVDRSTTSISTSVTAIHNSVINFRKEMKRLNTEYPNISSNMSWISARKEIDSINYQVSDIEQAGITVNNQILNIRRVTSGLGHHSSASTTSVLSAGNPSVGNVHGDISSATNGGNEGDSSYSEFWSDVHSLFNKEATTDYQAAAVPEPSSISGLLFAFSGVVAVRYRRKAK